MRIARKHGGTFEDALARECDDIVLAEEFMRARNQHEYRHLLDKAGITVERYGELRRLYDPETFMVS